MRSTAAIWSWLALALALAPGCGSTAAQAPTTVDSGIAVDTGAAVPNPLPPVADGMDAAAPAQPVFDAGVWDAGVAEEGVAQPDRAAPPAPDAASGRPMDASSAPPGPLPDAGAVAAGDAGEPPTSAFACTLLIGIEATEEWYIAGFETMVDNTRWELMWYHSGFVELWANPNDPVWATAITSPCAQNANKPDRVIFVALNYLNDTLAFWSPNVAGAVANIQAKYPSAKRIELMTFIRAPGNMACPQAPAPRSTITPAQDQSMAMVAAATPGLVFVAPQFEVKTCNEFSSNPPHPTAAGAMAWATMMANYYR